MRLETVTWSASVIVCGADMELPSNQLPVDEEGPSRLSCKVLCLV